MKKYRWWMIVAFIVYAALSTGSARFHCGRCADQRTVFYVLGISWVIEPHYDEYGIVETWEDVHGRPCENIWLNGPFDDRNPNLVYWPKLHFAAAVMRHTDDLKTRLAEVGGEELNRKDALGRTLLHWLATHEDTTGRKSLMDALVARGANLNARDEDGLTPLDWLRNADSGRLARLSTSAMFVSIGCGANSGHFAIRLRSPRGEVATFTLMDDKREARLESAITQWRISWDRIVGVQLRVVPHELTPSYLLILQYRGDEGAIASKAIGLVDDACIVKLRQRYTRLLNVETFAYRHQ